MTASETRAWNGDSNHNSVYPRDKERLAELNSDLKSRYSNDMRWFGVAYCSHKMKITNTSMKLNTIARANTEKENGTWNIC